MFFKIYVLKNFANFETPTQVFSGEICEVFSCEICEIFKNNFFYRTPPVAAPGIGHGGINSHSHIYNGLRITLVSITEYGSL